MAARESGVVRSAVKRLNGLDKVFCFRTHGSVFQQAGTPDIVGVARGRFFAIEMKRSRRERTQPDQDYILGRIAKAGGKTFVSHDPRAEDVIAWVHSLSA